MRYLKNVRLGDIRILSFFLFLWSAQKQLLMLSGVGKHRKASNAYNATLASVICLQKLYFNLLAWYAVSSLIILAITSNSYHSWLKKKVPLCFFFLHALDFALTIFFRKSWVWLFYWKLALHYVKWQLHLSIHYTIKINAKVTSTHIQFLKLAWRYTVDSLLSDTSIRRTLL